MAPNPDQVQAPPSQSDFPKTGSPVLLTASLVGATNIFIKDPVLRQLLQTIVAPVLGYAIPQGWDYCFLLFKYQSDIKLFKKIIDEKQSLLAQELARPKKDQDRIAQLKQSIAALEKDLTNYRLSRIRRLN